MTDKTMQQVLLVTDIFGHCNGLPQLLQDLSSPDRSITLVDPYQGKTQSFSSEQHAYAAYCERCGHDHYASLVSQAIADSRERFDVAIGFSAGASALWRALASRNASKVQQAVLFYPGKIHQQLELTPRVPVQLIFGNSEPHFDVASLCRMVSDQPTVQASSSPFEHGFMNPASKAYSEQGYQRYLRMLREMIG